LLPHGAAGERHALKRALWERNEKNSKVVLNFVRCRLPFKPAENRGQQDRHRDGLAN
jgi:hypothetical protein